MGPYPLQMAVGRPQNGPSLYCIGYTDSLYSRPHTPLNFVSRAIKITPQSVFMSLSHNKWRCFRILEWISSHCCSICVGMQLIVDILFWDVQWTLSSGHCPHIISASCWCFQTPFASLAVSVKQLSNWIMLAWYKACIACI